MAGLNTDPSLIKNSFGSVQKKLQMHPGVIYISCKILWWWGREWQLGGKMKNIDSREKMKRGENCIKKRGKRLKTAFFGVMNSSLLPPPPIESAHINYENIFSGQKI